MSTVVEIVSVRALSLASINETITHKAQNELSFSISSDKQSYVVLSEYVTVVWPPKSLPVKKAAKLYVHLELN